MHIKTSIHISDRLLDHLDCQADTLQISRSRLISLLLLHFIEDNKAGTKPFQKIQYQEKEIECQWKTAGISLRHDIYERWCSVRVVYKLSASFIIAIAIKKYLDKIISDNKIVDEVYNYCPVYIINSTYHDNIYINTTIWGMPDKKTLEKILNI